MYSAPIFHEQEMCQKAGRAAVPNVPESNCNVPMWQHCILSLNFQIIQKQAVTREKP
jgi:hypothetical protein